MTRLKNSGAHVFVVCNTVLRLSDLRSDWQMRKGFLPAILALERCASKHLTACWMHRVFQMQSICTRELILP